MASNSSTSLCPSRCFGITGQSPVDDLFGQLSTVFYTILDSPLLTGTPIRRAGQQGLIQNGCPGRMQITPVGFTSLLLGIASALMLVGSFAFMIGMMLMPLVGLVAVVVSIGALVTNINLPGSGLWNRDLNNSGTKRRITEVT